MGKVFKSFFSRIKKRWYIFVILAVGLVIFQLQKSSSESNVREKNTYKVKRQTIKDELSLSGQIDADEHVVLRFQSSGRLSWVGVKEGQMIKKYQLVASLDQREVEQNLKKYLNTFVKSRLDFDEELQDSGIQYTGGLTQDARRDALRVLEKAQYDLNNSIIDVELRNLAIEYSRLFSPIEGIVVRVGSPYAGVNITPSQAEFEIINTKTIYFSATADQTDITKLRQGLNGAIVLDAYPEEKLEGTVNMISFVPREDETGTVYDVKIVLSSENNNDKFRFRMTGDITFILKERKNIIAIPTLYIKSEAGKKYVWKLENSKKTKTFISLGDVIDGVTVVKSGLASGDVIEN